MAATHEDRNAQLSPGVAIKAPCRAATTAAITLSGEQTIDGVACVSGDRVLVKNQTNSIDNGIWGVSTGAWSRQPDFDGNRDVVTGTFVFITSGSVNAGSFYECTTTGTVVFGTSNITFAVGALGPIALPLNLSNTTFTQAGTGATARTGLDKTRDIISVKDFGAIGDGVTDDTAAFTAAQATGKWIFVPQSTGNYITDATITATRLFGPGIVVANGTMLVLYIAANTSVNWNTFNQYLGINTALPTGVLEIANRPGENSADLKVVGINGQSDTVEIAMVQDQGGLRTYGGYFLIKSTTSDLTWTRRVNLADTEVFRVANATGNIGINIATATGFKVALARVGATVNVELGIYSHTGSIVGSLGIEGVSTNDLQIASIGAIRFYSASTIAAGSTPTNEILRITSTVLQFGTNTAKGAEAFASFITINDSGGTPRKLMVCA